MVGAAATGRSDDDFMLDQDNLCRARRWLRQQLYDTGQFYSPLIWGFTGPSRGVGDASLNQSVAYRPILNIPDMVSLPWSGIRIS